MTKCREGTTVRRLIVVIYQHQGLEQIRGAINLRNEENQTRAISSCAKEEIFGQNLGQSLKDDTVAVVVSD